MIEYEVTRFSKSQVKKAGNYIAKHNSDSPDYDYNIAIVDNWRAAHAYPLNCISEIVREALKDKPSFLVVQRLKRCESIIGKLQRPVRSSLDRMQDLGGCRVIVPFFSDLYDTVRIVRESIIKEGHIIQDEDDYLKNPPSHSGYRCYHIVVKYQADDAYNNMLVELQIRTKLQHSWATAVEIIDNVEKETLKAGTGRQEYRYFFKLASALFSIEEGTTIVEGVPTTPDEIIKELYKIENTYHLREKLSAYSNAIKITGKYPRSAAYYLLVTDMRKKAISVTPYSNSEISSATNAYSAKERFKNNGIDVVLVAGNNFDVIRESYPNYFLEAKFFLQKLSEFCLKQPEVPSFLLDTSTNSFPLAEMFKAEYHPGNIPERVSIIEDGIGVIDGDTIYCPSWAITLDNSYLRYSAIVRNLDEEIIKGNIEPYIVQGPAIIATYTGACFYINKQTCRCISDQDCIIIRPREKVNEKYLLLVIAWLKSNLCTWDMLWNHHSHCVYDKETFFSITVPGLDEKSLLNIVELVNDILAEEYHFIKNLQDIYKQEDEAVLEEEINKFNSSILRQLQIIENLFADFYNVSLENRETIKRELKLKGYYVYY